MPSLVQINPGDPCPDFDKGDPEPEWPTLVAFGKN